MTANTRMRKQIRTFALVWTGITVLMGACTFAAIYIAYGALNTPNRTVIDTRNVAIPPSSPSPQQAAAAASSTPIPTRILPTATATFAPIQAMPTREATAEVGAAAVEATVEATPTLLPVDDRVYQVGIQVQQALDGNPEMQDTWMGEVEKLGMEWFKQQVRWEDIEPENNEYDWSYVDLALNSAADHGLKVMLSIVTAPEWSREPGVDTSKHGPPADPNEYVTFVTDLLKRHPGKVHAIEVWNEQNLDREWFSMRGLSATNYVDLLRRTYTAVKEIDPGIIIISGALSPTGGWTEPNGVVSAIDDFVYMDQLISAGMLTYADCVGAHHNGYNIGPSQVWNNVTNDPSAQFRGPFENPHHSWSFRSTLQTYADKIELAGGDQKLCVTEFGWASTEDLPGYPPGFEFAVDNTLEEQRDWTIEAVSNMEEWDIVWLAFLWNLNYGPQAGWATDNDNVPYSIIGKDWAFRPVYDAIGEWQRDYEARLNR
jgi:polysaccharide biosynthesis protein PslG